MEYYWPGPDDQSIVEDMKRDSKSLHWDECSLFIRCLLAKMNIPDDAKDDIAQQSWAAIREKLHSFKHEARLTCWIYRVVINKVRDHQRKCLKEKSKCISVNIPKNVVIIDYLATAAPSAEDQYLQREELYELIDLLREFVRMHKNTRRNARILHLILLEGYTPREVEKHLGVNLPIINFVCREARKFIREKHKKN